MINFDPSMPSQQPNRRVEKRLSLPDDHNEEITANLIETIDQLRVSSDPYIFKRSAEDVPIYHGESHLPARYNLLNFDHASLANGTYKTKITLPGHTLTLEGTRADDAGSWRIFYGKEEGISLKHSDVITYLQSILPVRPQIDKLADTAIITDHAINEALWQDISPLTFEWQETSLYSTSRSHYTPSLTKDMPTHIESNTDEDYASSVAAVMGYTISPSGEKYSCRIGTQLPIDLYDPTNTSSTKPADIHEEHAFSVEIPDRTAKRRLALATYAIESNHLTSGHLQDLTATTVRYFDDVPSIYDKAASLIKDEYLNIDDLLNE